MSETSAETAYPAASAPAVVVHTIADPAPLGLAGFAMTTLVLSLANANIYPAAATAALSLAIFYGGLAQLLAGMWEFKRNNVFGATAFTSYGAFWLSFWYLVVHGAIPAADAPVVVGTFLLGWTVFTFYMTIASLRVSGAVFVVFVLLSITFLLLCIGAYHSKTGITHAGGYFGIATAAAAWYASFAGVTNSTFGKIVLPVYPLAR
jgi:uncharacterized protein